MAPPVSLLTVVPRVVSRGSTEEAGGGDVCGEKVRVQGKLLAVVLGEQEAKGEGWIVRGAEGGCTAESTGEDEREDC